MRLWCSTFAGIKGGPCARRVRRALAEPLCSTFASIDGGTGRIRHDRTDRGVRAPGGGPAADGNPKREADDCGAARGHVECREGGGETGEETLWLSVLAFGRVAEDPARHAKGDPVSVSGRLNLNRYQSRDGEARCCFAL